MTNESIDSLSGIKDWSGGSSDLTTSDEDIDEIYFSTAGSSTNAAAAGNVPDDIKAKLKALIKVYPDGIEVQELKKSFMVRAKIHIHLLWLTFRMFD